MKNMQILTKQQIDLLLNGTVVKNLSTESSFVWYNNQWWKVYQVGDDQFYLKADLDDFPIAFGKQILVLEEVLDLLHLRMNIQDFLIIKPELEKLAQQSF